MKRRLILGFVLVLFLSSCKKNADQQSDPQNVVSLKTLSVENIYPYQVDIGGDIADDGGESITSRGVCWAENDHPTTSDSMVLAGTGTGVFKVTIKNLQSNHRYYAKAFAINRFGTVYGNRISFITSIFVPSKPSVSFTRTDNIAPTTFDVTARVTGSGGATVTERGFLWDTVETNTLTPTNHVAVGSDTGNFNIKIVGLLPFTKYYLYAYAINSAGMSLSSSTATTLAPTLPIVVTSPLIFNDRLVTSGGTITGGNGYVISERGITYTTNKEPGVIHKVVSGSGVGSFTASFTPTYFTGGAGYAVRAYAVYSYKTLSGTAYGDIIQFFTP